MEIKCGSVMFYFLCWCRQDSSLLTGHVTAPCVQHGSRSWRWMILRVHSESFELWHLTRVQVCVLDILYWSLVFFDSVSFCLWFSLLISRRSDFCVLTPTSLACCLFILDCCFHTSLRVGGLFRDSFLLVSYSSLMTSAGGLLVLADTDWG